MATKLTETRLRQIIRQEAQRLSENSPERGDGGSYDRFAKHIETAITNAGTKFPRFIGGRLSDQLFVAALKQKLADMIRSQLGTGSNPGVDAMHVLLAAEEVLDDRLRGTR